MLRRCGRRFWIQIANELIVVIMNTTFTVCATIVDYLIYESMISLIVLKFWSNPRKNNIYLIA